MAEETGKETKDETPAETTKETDTTKPPGGDDNIRAIIREEIAKALGDSKPTVTPGSSRASSIEKEAREAVEREAAKLTKEKEHEKEHETLKTQKLEPEKTPVKMRALTRLFWGSNE